MAYLKSKTLFFTTSPRTPLKMIPEIEVLERYFEGKVWNPDTQVEFIKKLAQGKDFQGEGSKKEMSFSARDRINRAPKALGFVDLKPTIKITQPGRQFICDNNFDCCCCFRCVCNYYNNIYDTLSIFNPEERRVKSDEALIDLLKQMCKAAHVKCNNWNDSRFKRVCRISK